MTNVRQVAAFSRVVLRRALPLTLFVAAHFPLAAFAGDTIFDVANFADPPGSLVYFDGFSGAVGETKTWPAEMGWQGDTIDVAFTLSDDIPADARQYRLRLVVPWHYDQSFDLTISAGSSSDNLVAVETEFIDTPRIFAATIPLDRFTPGQTNFIRIQGQGVRVGYGEPSGIRWSRWLLTRTDLPASPDEMRRDQLKRLAAYLRDAIEPNGLVRDSLPLSDGDDPFHPATPDAAGFALIGLCIVDRFELLSEDPAVLVESILSAYAGETDGVIPERNAKGHWWHWLDVKTGTKAAGWGDAYTTIGSAILVNGALFAANHFSDNARIRELANKLQSTTDFNAMIHPSKDGRVYLATDKSGNQMFGSVVPWNEYALIVELALRQSTNDRATAVKDKWLDPSKLPKRSYRGLSTLTDNSSRFAPAFWVHAQYFFSADFASNSEFVRLMHNHRRADELYCVWELGQKYRYGLTAGVSPSGYTVDIIGADNGVFSPEAAMAWGEFDTLLEFLDQQRPASDSRLRYGATRVSADDPDWIPFDAGLVDHTFLMYGLAESIESTFFKSRQAFQADADLDGIADAFDVCPIVFNRLQLDSDRDGIGDACACNSPWADADGDTDVDLHDFARMQRGPTADESRPESAACFDRNGDRRIDGVDLGLFGDCVSAAGPDVPADPDCGE